MLFTAYLVLRLRTSINCGSCGGPMHGRICTLAPMIIVLYALPAPRFKAPPSTFDILTLPFPLPLSSTMESSYAHLLNHPCIRDAPNYDNDISEISRARLRFREEVELKFREIRNEANGTYEELAQPNFGLDKNLNVAGCSAEEQQSFCDDSTFSPMEGAQGGVYGFVNASSNTWAGGNKQNEFGSVLYNKDPFTEKPVHAVAPPQEDRTTAQQPTATTSLLHEQVALLRTVHEARFMPEKITDDVLAQLAPFIPLLMEEAKRNSLSLAPYLTQWSTSY
ncbi:hypothetical protein E1B28_005535 [Marasmius oreades]|uniref:Uncharacterized protein n=1 Tax=Marasmius oreades TaxID=181124 RepID=A0A9P7UUX3_9AGAR|nr:uncharacterized protein E1B28_005535 [Marasmius oreades]KAG7094715.1 hypothetical protein E1B28_005535 [Marasmius oreades]